MEAGNSRVRQSEKRFRRSLDQRMPRKIDLRGDRRYARVIDDNKFPRAWIEVTLCLERIEGRMQVFNARIMRTEDNG